MFWDGEETKDAGYCLLGCSVGGDLPDSSTTLQGPHLQSADMLDLLLEVSGRTPGAHHVAFAFDYDVNQIIQDLSWRDLIMLRRDGKCRWENYEISHIPHKVFTVRDLSAKRSIRIDDCFSFFRKRFDKALAKHGIGERELLDEISAGKDKREDFWYADIGYIHGYWAKEVVYGCLLMDKIRTMCHNAGFYVKRWHGPGALAAYSLNQQGTTRYMAQGTLSTTRRIQSESTQNTVPVPVRTAALYAYAGGWFERFKMGMKVDTPFYTYDINSAYVYAMSLLPGLAGGQWTHLHPGNASEQRIRGEARNCRFGLFNTQWNPTEDLFLASSVQGIPVPLFHRDRDGRLCRPASRTNTWLWNPEAANASVFPFATFREAWIWEPGPGSEYPFEWVNRMYLKRNALKRAGDPSEQILKWAMASYYGRIAQRTGWNQESRTAPKFHQIEWAGWITSWCRAAIYRAAFQAASHGGLVSVDTDGIISTVPITGLTLGDGLGEWKEETYDGLIYLQNGVYWLRRDGEWEDPKLRGIPTTRLSHETAVEALRNGGQLNLSRRSFTGYGAALHGNRGNWRKWIDTEVTIDAQSAGGRVHVPGFCRACHGGRDLASDLHALALIPQGGSFSQPHKLPWLGQAGKPDLKEHMICES